MKKSNFKGGPKFGGLTASRVANRIPLREENLNFLDLILYYPFKICYIGSQNLKSRTYS
jgi:hypothetical protein